MQRIMNLFSKNGNMGRWMTKKGILVLICVALTAVLAAGALGVAGADGKIKGI